MSPLTDHDLTALVEAAASGAVNAQAAHHGGDTWDDMHPSIKNTIRENALPFIYHGTKALEELGYTKPRMAMTAADLDALPAKSAILDSEGTPWVGDGDTVEPWASVCEDPFGGPIWKDSRDIALPATVLHAGGAS